MNGQAPSRRKVRFSALIGPPAHCYLCGEPLAHETAVLEHVQPKCSGGPGDRRGCNLPENYRWACRRCNRIKGTQTLEELIDFAQRLLARFPLG